MVAKQNVISEAMQLSEADRLEIADALYESIELPADPTAADAWDEEIRKRMEQARAGNAKFVPWIEARKHIAGDNDGGASREILEAAMEEMQAARLWYEKRSATAALRFMNELDRAIEQIVEHPERSPEHLHGTRRYLMRRFPYLVVYEVLLDRVRVIACQHGRQRPGYWRERI